MNKPLYAVTMLLLLVNPILCLVLFMATNPPTREPLGQLAAVFVIWLMGMGYRELQLRLDRIAGF